MSAESESLERGRVITVSLADSIKPTALNPIVQAIVDQILETPAASMRRRRI